MPEQHVLQVAGDRDLLHREGDLAVLDPEAAGAARVVAGHVVDALPHQLDHEQAACRACASIASRSSPGCVRRERQRQVVRAAGVAGGLHAELARRIASTGNSPATTPPSTTLRLRVAHAFVVERRAALAARQVRVFVHVDVRRQHLLAEAVEQESCSCGTARRRWWPAPGRRAGRPPAATRTAPGTSRGLDLARLQARTARAPPHSGRRPRARPARRPRASSCTRRRAACRRRWPAIGATEIEWRELA